MLRSLFTSSPASVLSRSAALRASRWLCAALLLLCLAAPAEAAYMPVPWVFTDPKHDPFNPLKYITSNTLTAIAICEFSFLPPSPLFSSYVPRGRCEVGRSRATGAAPAGTLLTTTTTPAFLGAGARRRWEAGAGAGAGAEAEVEVEAAAWLGRRPDGQRSGAARMVRTCPPPR